MTLPAVAARTYNAFKGDSGFRKLLKQMGRKLQKLNDPIKRTMFVHSKIDDEIKKLFKDESVQQLVNCKKGCSACCHTQVAVTEDEAVLLVDLIVKGQTIDWSKLLIQAKTANSAKEFFQLPYSMRSCIFLDREGSCSVYEDRPSVCRTNYVVSSPDHCVIGNGQGSSVKLLNTFGADSWIYSFFSMSKRSGALPFLVKKLLDERQTGHKSSDYSAEN